MYCKNCNAKIKEGCKFCSECGNEVLDKKNNESKSFKLIIYLLLYVFILVVFCFMIYYMAYGIMSIFGKVGFLFVISFIISLFIPLYFILIKLNMNKTLIIIFVVFLSIFSNVFIYNLSLKKISFKEDKKFYPVKASLDNLYSNNYEVIEKCYYWNTGGDKKYETIIKVDNTYALFDYDLKTGEIYSSLEGTINGKNHLINTTIKNNLHIPYYSHLMFDNNTFYNYSNIHISLIINKKDMLSETFINDFKNLYDKLDSMYEVFIIRIYVTDSIDFTKKNEYDLFLTSRIAIRCDVKFENKFNKSLVEPKYYAYFSEEDNVTYDYIKDIMNRFYNSFE